MREQLEDAAMAAANKVTAAGSLGTVFGWLTSSEAGVVLGILIGVIGLCMNWYFKSRADRRAETAHQAFMNKLALPVAGNYPALIEELKAPGEDD